MGYDKTDTVPATVGILNGKGDTPPVEIDTVPGSRFFYSGGGFVILQQVIEDVSGTSFKEYFAKEVFPPLGMSHSTFDQFPGDNVSSAHNWTGKPYPHGWRIFPAMAAAGLWTTPSDLAEFCFAIENAYDGKNGAFISQELAKQMLIPVEGRGLGVALETDKEAPFFFHGGSNPGGYRNFMVDAYKQRTGIVIMTNATQGRRLHDDILRSFSNFFEINILEPRLVKPASLERDALKKFAGHYQLEEELEYPLEVSISPENELILYDPNDGMRNVYLPLSDSTFVEMNDASEISFKTDAHTGEIKSMDFSGTYTFYKIR